MRESSGDVRGRIKLSAPRTFADAPIGQSLIDFVKEHSDIVLEIDLDDRFVRRAVQAVAGRDDQPSR